MFTSIGSIFVLVLGILLIVGAGLYIIKFLSLAKESKANRALAEERMMVDFRLNRINE